MARVLAVVPDLMLGSRVTEALKASGHDVELVPGLPGEVEADLIVCDLEAVDPGLVAGAEAPAIGFYSHVDVDTRSRAVEAGLELVVPRSRMARELPSLAESLLGR